MNKIKEDINSNINKDGEKNIIEYWSHSMLEFMLTLQAISSDTSFSNGRKNVMRHLHKKKSLDAALHSGAICPNCGSTIKSDSSLSTYLFAVSVVILLQKRMITPKKLVLPTRKMIVDVLAENGAGADFSLRCQNCNFEEHKIVDIIIEPDGNSSTDVNIFN